MSPQRLPFIDWMKCAGILLIVFGHVTSLADGLVAPAYPKQLGVAFFFCITGYSLAKETRNGLRVLFNRMFEIYLFGIAAAVVMSVISYSQGLGLNLSNYLPFLGGINVAFNSFPANPTTWYIGTYLHAILLWVVFLRRVRLTLGILIAAMVAEVVLRAAAMQYLGLFVAYMSLPNWLSVFLMGMYLGRRQEQANSVWLSLLVAGLGLLAVGWSFFASRLPAEHTFPLMQFQLDSPVAGLCLTSVAVTGVYLLFTWLAFQLACSLPDLAGVRFMARNTLIVFIAHMPVFYAINQPISDWVGSFWVRLAIRFLICSIVLAVASEVIRRLIQPELLREKVWQSCTGKLAAAFARPPAKTENVPVSIP